MWGVVIFQEYINAKKNQLDKSKHLRGRYSSKLEINRHMRKSLIILKELHLWTIINAHSQSYRTPTPLCRSINTKPAYCMRFPVRRAPSASKNAGSIMLTTVSSEIGASIARISSFRKRSQLTCDEMRVTDTFFHKLFRPLESCGPYLDLYSSISSNSIMFQRYYEIRWINVEWSERELQTNFHQ